MELSHFAEVPHLLSPVIVHPKRATEALEWIVREMEMRYEMLATVGVRDIDGYEEGLRDGTLRTPGRARRTSTSTWATSWSSSTSSPT